MATNGKQAAGNQSPAELLTRLRRSAQFGLALILILIAIGSVAGAYVMHHHENEFLATQLFAFAVALSAYVIATWFHDLLVRRYLEASIEASITRHVAAGFSEIAGEHKKSVANLVASATDKINEIEQESYSVLSRQFPEFLPTQVFPPANESNPAFGRSMNEALSHSSTFYFKGVTARYLASAIRQLAPSLRCEVLILDPRLEQELWLYAQSRYAKEENIFARKTELVDRVKNEIYSSIVALWDCSSVCPISVKLHHGPVFYRVEMFDDRAFVSFYVDFPKSVYPVCYEYGHNTFYFRAFQRDITDTLAMDRPSLDMSTTASERQLTTFLAKIGCRQNVDDLRRKAEEIYDELSVHWGNM